MVGWWAELTGRVERDLKERERWQEKGRANREGKGRWDNRAGVDRSAGLIGREERARAEGQARGVAGLRVKELD